MGWTLPTKNGRWIARYRTPNGDTRSKTWDRKTDADRWRRAAERKIDTGMWIDPGAGSAPLETVAATFQATRIEVGEGTRERDKCYLRSLIIPALGSTPVGRISPKEVQTFVAKLVEEGRSPETVRKAYQILKMVLDDAVQHNMIATNPCPGTRLPQIVRRKIRFLDLSEVHAVAAVIDPRFRAMVYVGALAGLRIGEAAALQVTSFDRRQQTLTVVENLSDVAGRPPALGPVKTPASRRTIVIPQYLVDELDVHIAGHSGGSFLFEAPGGGPLRLSNWRRRTWKPAVRQSVGEDVRFHDLRHTHVSLLIDQGEHPKAIQTRLGHTSITTTMDRYGHLFEGTDQAVALRLNEVLADPSAHSARTPSPV